MCIQSPLSIIGDYYMNMTERHSMTGNALQAEQGLERKCWIIEWCGSSQQ